ncbi:MAG TPA: preprotein translocase subunit SecA [Tepidisphaeraceae bacterium]|jgi:preprotein translocase subunit SecA
MAVGFSKVFVKIFGSRNERLLKRFAKMVAQVSAMEEKVQAMTDDELRSRTVELKAGLKSRKLRSPDVYPEAFAIMRESMDRNIGIRQILNPEEDPLNKFDPDKLDDKMLQAYDAVQKRMIETGESWQKVPIPVELYNAVRMLYPESRPPYRARCFDVQLIGGLVLYEGKIAEMATGEGKTFVAPLACFMKVLEGLHCHVVTVNDYLVKRDSQWVKPAFEALGMSVGYIQSDMEPGGDSRRAQYDSDITYGTNSEFGFDYLRDNMKERVDLQVQGPLDYTIVDEVDSILIDEARTPLIISGAAHDDAPKYRASDDVARKIMELNKPWNAVEKEVDAAKRAIKSAEGDSEKAKTKEEKEAARKRGEEAQIALAEAEKRKEGLTQYYEVEWDRKSVHLTHEGIAAAQEIAGVGSFYVGSNMEWPHLMEQAMRAHVVYEKDKDYVVERGQRGDQEVIIVDEFTGRKMVGRQWSDGLHQAVEAKEKVTIKQETQTLATITLQNFFKLYKSLAGMTGTAQTEAEEFNKIYRLEVVTIPTNRVIVRQDNEDRVYRKEREKWESIIDEIKAFSDAGRPVLVGTTSVEKSEMLSMILKRKWGVEHEVLNAKYHEREAHIVALAGQTHKNSHGELVGNVTIATNMAGRGTDIKPARETFYEVSATPSDGTGGKYVLAQRVTGKVIEVDPNDAENPLVQVFQLNDKAKTVGGLHVIGTERHTARRIDNQLRGRSGRQGDPGSSRFYVSLEDDLMKMFAGEWVIKVLGWLGMEEGVPIEDARITKGILKAQKKVEERNFLARKNLLDYDEVMDHQRTTFYGMRQQVLEGRDVDQVIWGMIGDSITDAVDKYITRDFVAANLVEWAKTNFDVALDAGDFRGMREIDEIEHFIKDQARAEAETNITATLGEFMGEDSEDTLTWDAKGLSSWAMSRFQVNLPQNQIRKMNSDELEERLRMAAVEQIDKRDSSSLLKYLEPLYPEKELVSWAKEKFAIELDPKELLLPTGRDGDRKPSEETVKLIEDRAREAYARREVEYPIDHMLSFTFGGSDGQQVDNPYAAEYVRSWARAKYGADLSMEYLRGLNLRKLRDELIGHQDRLLRDGELEKEIKTLASANKSPEALLAAFNQRFGGTMTLPLIEEDIAAQAARSNGTGQAPDVATAMPGYLLRKARNFLRQELTDLEQFVLIQIFDQTWKDHLYAMDMLKGSVGLAGFAEQDPRIIYKKEGYDYFRQMMQGVRDKVTDLIFRARIVGQQQARSAYRETAAVHEQGPGYGVSENLAAAATAEAEVAPDGEMQAASDRPQGEATVAKPFVREEPKVGRNDLCPCGSGKKYKKCHGANVV